ncbi:MAG: response regulator transcription factor [Gemmatimonadaceae bacterium]
MTVTQSIIRVLAADDHPVVRAGITAMLEYEADIEVVAEASNGAEAITLFESKRPDVVLMDLQMPLVNGLSAIRSIREIDADARIVALTTFDGDADIHRALSAGAISYLLKDAMVDQLVDAIRAAAIGKRFIPPKVAGRLVEFIPRIDLTARELEVLQRVAKGMSNKEIAEEVGRSSETVKAQLESIFRKLEAKDRAHAVAIGLQRGFIHFE